MSVASSRQMNFVYFLKSLKNKKVYVGSTERDLYLRLEEHNKGMSNWTKNNGPFKLIYFEKYFCINDAREREKFYKSGFGRKVKSAIINLIK
jgi:putative endonuclease